MLFFGKKKKKIGLALGSGAARGIAHLGVIKALKDKGIEIDMVSGTSIGAIVGAVFCAGELDELDNFVRNMTWKNTLAYFDLSIPKSGLINGTKLSNLIYSYTKTNNFDDLEIPLFTVSTNIKTGQEVIINKGDLIQAVRSSISLPGFFNPVEIDGNWLVDGGLTNPIPINILRQNGCDIVIAVNLNKDLTKGKNKNKKSVHKLNNFFNKLINKNNKPSIVDVLVSSIKIAEMQITEHSLKYEKPDILIEPDLSHFGLFDFHKAEEGIDEGYKKTSLEIAKIKKLISK